MSFLLVVNFFVSWGYFFLVVVSLVVVANALIAWKDLSRKRCVMCPWVITINLCSITLCCHNGTLVFIINIIITIIIIIVICNMLSGGKMGDYQNCSVLDCVLKLCIAISTLRWAVFICVYFVCFCFILHICCIIVSMVGWTWGHWSLILGTLSSFSALTLLVGSFDS